MTQSNESAAAPVGLSHETFVCSRADNMVEWGFCFKKPGSEDTEFDLVIGGARYEDGIEAKIDADFSRLGWAAKAISDASVQHAATFATGGN